MRCHTEVSHCVFQSSDRLVASQTFLAFDDFDSFEENWSGVPKCPWLVICLTVFSWLKWDYMFECFPGGSEVKASAWNAGDLGSIPELGRSPGEGNGSLPSVLAWRIPWREEPGRLQSTGSQSVGHDWATSLSFFHFHMFEGGRS